MQELACEAVAARAPVALVGDDRVADRGEVDANLVGAAGLEPDLEQGVVSDHLHDLEVGHRRARRPPSHRPAFRGAVVATERSVDRS